MLSPLAPIVGIAVVRNYDLSLIRMPAGVVCGPVLKIFREIAVRTNRSFRPARGEIVRPIRSRFSCDFDQRFALFTVTDAPRRVTPRE